MAYYERSADVSTIGGSAVQVFDARMHSNTPIPPTITVHQAAHVLQVQPATVYTWIRDDEFPHIRLGGRIRIPTAKLADLLGISPREVIDGLGVTDLLASDPS